MKKLVVQNLLKVWLCAMVSFMTVTLYAQGNSFKVSGTVKDNTGELVIGATVIDTKTKNGCVTDVDGNFSLEVTPNSSIKVNAERKSKVDDNTAKMQSIKWLGV